MCCKCIHFTLSLFDCRSHEEKDEKTPFFGETHQSPSSPFPCVMDADERREEERNSGRKSQTASGWWGWGWKGLGWCFRHIQHRKSGMKEKKEGENHGIMRERHALPQTLIFYSLNNSRRRDAMCSLDTFSFVSFFLFWILSLSLCPVLHARNRFVCLRRKGIKGHYESPLKMILSPSLECSLGVHCTLNHLLLFCIQSSIYASLSFSSSSFLVFMSHVCPGIWFIHCVSVSMIVWHHA